MYNIYENKEQSGFKSIITYALVVIALLFIAGQMVNGAKHVGTKVIKATSHAIDKVIDNAPVSVDIVIKKK